jgi:hypothetical protein
MRPPVSTVGGPCRWWEASPMVVSPLTQKPSQRTDDHHFAYPVVRPLPRPPVPAASPATW